MFHQEQILNAVVESIHYFGVFVRLEDGTRGYIRKRECSLEGVKAPGEVVSLGQTVSAAVKELPAENRTLELTLCLPNKDPWRNLPQSIQPGSVVPCIVRDITPAGIFVQVFPGVRGFVPVDEIVPWKISTPEQIFWEEDETEAVITHLDVGLKKLRLSVRLRLEQLGRVNEIIQKLSPQTAASEKETGLPDDFKAIFQESLRQIAFSKPVLVVEDNDELRMLLLEWLSELPHGAKGVENAEKAIQMCLQEEFSALILDLELPDGDGLSILSRLRNCGFVTPAIIMSGAEALQQKHKELDALAIGRICIKPLELEEIYNQLKEIACGENSFRNSPLSMPEEIREKAQPMQSLVLAMRQQTPLIDRFEQGLKQLVEDVHADLAIVFSMDEESKQISISALFGDLPRNEKAILGLVNSPVKDVIVEESFVVENNASQEKTGRFRKLLDFVSFESCMGVPVRTAKDCQHALFIFHHAPEAFSRFRIRDVIAMAALFSVALESHEFEQRLISWGKTLLNGQLAAAFSHELNNKISSLDLRFHNLRSSIATADRTTRSDSKEHMKALQDAVDNAIQTTQEIKRTVVGFRRLMGPRVENAIVDINIILTQAIEDNKRLARDPSVEILFHPDQALPLVAASQVGLYQAFTNLILNAIQQMQLQLKENRILTISTHYVPGAGKLPIQVRFMDTGPGIHRSLLNSGRIFTLGFTTRPEGSGLGLYITKSLLASFRGEITVEKSRVPLGTTFLISLPTADLKVEEEKSL